MNWIALTDESDLKVILQADAPIAIFKHSTRCSISLAAKGRIESEWESVGIPIYYLDLIQYRSISNQLAKDLNVKHESPQLIIVKKGEVLLHRSHFEIQPRQLATHI